MTHSEKFLYKSREQTFKPLELNLLNDEVSLPPSLSPPFLPLLSLQNFLALLSLILIPFNIMYFLQFLSLSCLNALSIHVAQFTVLLWSQFCVDCQLVLSNNRRTKQAGRCDSSCNEVPFLFPACARWLLYSEIMDKGSKQETSSLSY